MVNQIAIAGVVQGLAEALNFARKAGLDVGAVIETISKGAAQSWQMENRYQAMDTANFAPGFAVDWIRKDLAICLDEARRTHQAWLVAMFGDRLPTTPAARKRAVHALHAATDVYVWKLLRRDLHLSRTETEKTMTDLVVGILEGTTR